jgi:hypothetical protein
MSPRHRKLRSIHLRELYDFDAHAFPDELPDLESVTIHGLQKDHSAVLKKKLASVPTAKVTGARTPEWIKTNLHNPFREWEEDDARMGKAACAAWLKASALAEKAGAAASKETAEVILRGLVDALNKIDKRTSLDTIRRDESGEAFMDLAGRFSRVPPNEAAKWFDAWRNF